MRDLHTTFVPANSHQIIVILISEEKFHKLNNKKMYSAVFADCVCPICESSDFTYHCQYSKYLYSRTLRIIRVLCHKCRSTHALIPDFSLPGTSIGTTESQEYLSLRAKGLSQKQAGKVFTQQCLSWQYGIRFEKRVTAALCRLTALFTGRSEELFSERIKATDQNYLLKLNKLCLREGFNPVFFSRVSILRIREQKRGICHPLNKAAPLNDTEQIDSS